MKICQIERAGIFDLTGLSILDSRHTTHSSLHNNFQLLFKGSLFSFQFSSYPPSLLLVQLYGYCLHLFDEQKRFSQTPLISLSTSVDTSEELCREPYSYLVSIQSFIVMTSNGDDNNNNTNTTDNRFGECVICRDELMVNPIGACNPCGHCFHTNCFAELNRYHQQRRRDASLKCPLCNVRVTGFLRLYLGNADSSSPAAGAGHSVVDGTEHRNGFLEHTIPSLDNAQSDSDMDVVNESEDDDSILAVINSIDGPNEIVVEGAGNPAVNGVYHHDGIFSCACRYAMFGRWNNADLRFLIFQCSVSNNTLHWYISIVPFGGIPGSSTDIDFYSAPVTDECRSVPPSTGWIKANEGTDPIPRLLYNNRSINPNEIVVEGLLS